MGAIPGKNIMVLIEILYIFLNKRFSICLYAFGQVPVYFFDKFVQFYHGFLGERICWVPYLTILEVLLLKLYKMYK